MSRIANIGLIAALAFMGPIASLSAQEATRFSVNFNAQRGGQSRTISVYPNDAQPTVHVAVGSVTTVTFVDENGAPLPILAAKPENRNNSKLKVEVLGDSTSNMVSVTPGREGDNGNLVVRFAGNLVSVVLAVDTAFNQVDYRLNVTVLKHH